MEGNWELEQQLRPPATEMAPYPAKYITLASGQKMVIRQARMDEIPLLLEIVEPLIRVKKDFYDIVAARVYAEILGMLRYRVRDEYILVGAVDGQVVSMCNGRLIDDKNAMSYHTMTVERGLRCGAQMFAAKMEYHMDFLGQENVYIVAESPIGFRRWMIEYQLEEAFDFQHELGGPPSYVLTKKLYEASKERLVGGIRPVPEDLLAKSQKLSPPVEYPQLPNWIPGWVK